MTPAPFTNLTTEHLYLRGIQLGDAEEIFRLRSDDRVNEFVDRPRAATIDDARQFIQKILTIVQNNEGFMWVITFTGEPKLMGTIVFWNIEWEKHQGEIGYELLPEHQGKGIMTEAIKKVIAFGFNELKFKTIVADPKKKNLRSIHLLDKLGFKLTGEDGEYLVYSLSHPADERTTGQNDKSL